MILSAIFALTRTIVNENTNNVDSVVIEEEQKSDLLQDDEENASDNLPRNASFDISKPLVAEEDDEEQEEPAQMNQTKLAFFVLLLAACFSAFWSPLLLVGHRDEEKPTGKSYVALLTFVRIRHIH